MKGLGKRATIIAILALCSTAFSAAGYSLWSEELRAEATVNTGTLDGLVVCDNAADNEAQGWPTNDPYSAYPSPTSPHDVGGGGAQGTTSHLIDVVLKDTYPGYAFRCEVHVSNTGSVAWHLEDITYQVSECDANGGDCHSLNPIDPAHKTWTTNCAGAACTWGDKGVTPPVAGQTWSPIFASVENQEGCQLHHDDPALAAWLMVGVNQPASEHVVYKVALSYTLQQWNESAWTGCGQPRTP